MADRDERAVVNDRRLSLLDRLVQIARKHPEQFASAIATEAVQYDWTAKTYHEFLQELFLRELPPPQAPDTLMDLVDKTRMPGPGHVSLTNSSSTWAPWGLVTQRHIERTISGRSQQCSINTSAVSNQDRQDVATQPISDTNTGSATNAAQSEGRAIGSGTSSKRSAEASDQEPPSKTAKHTANTCNATTTQVELNADQRHQSCDTMEYNKAHPAYWHRLAQSLLESFHPEDKLWKTISRKILDPFYNTPKTIAVDGIASTTGLPKELECVIWEGKLYPASEKEKLVIMDAAAVCKWLQASLDGEPHEHGAGDSEAEDEVVEDNEEETEHDDDGEAEC